MKLHTEYFYGNRVSEEGRKYNRLDYATLAKAFNHVMANDIMERTQDIGYWDIINGNDFNEDDDTFVDVYQWFIIDENGKNILKETDEILYENMELGLTVWGATHWGTSWDYVLTDIPINVPYDEKEN